MKKFIVFLLVLSLSFLQNSAFSQANQPAQPQKETIQAKDFSYLLGTLKGFSSEQLKQHFELYKGYVKSLNELNSKLETGKPKPGGATYSEYRAADIARPFANNGVILHELYFSNLTGKPTEPSETLMTYLKRDFGSYQNYIDDIRQAAKSARSGWVITGYNHRDKKLHNYIIDLHDEHVPAGITPIMVMDVWEHAYMIDYGIQKEAYIETFLRNLDWSTVSQRIESLTKANK